MWLWVERLNCNGIRLEGYYRHYQLPTMNCWLGVSQIHFCIWDSLVPGLVMSLHLGYSGITLTKHLLGSNHCYCDSTALTQGHLLLSKIQEGKAKPTNPWHNELIELLGQRKQQTSHLTIFSLVPLPPIKVSFTKSLLSPAAPPPSPSQWSKKEFSHLCDVTHSICLASFFPLPFHTHSLGLEQYSPSYVYVFIGVVTRSSQAPPSYPLLVIFYLRVEKAWKQGYLLVWPLEI